MSRRPPSLPDPDPVSDDAVDAAGLPLSKTQLKKQMAELQELGEQLAALSDDKLATIDMPEELRRAVLELKRTRSHEGRRRQLQYVGKRMRQADPGPIREALAAFRIGHAKDTLDLHRAERWRAELIASDQAVTDWVEEYPGSDVQQLRTLVRSARKDAAAAPEQRSGKGYRELYQFIKRTLAEAASPAGTAAADADAAQEHDDE